MSLAADFESDWVVEGESESSDSDVVVELEPVKKKCRTRGGIRSNISRVRQQDIANLDLEVKWKREDHPTNVPQFTAICKVNAVLPDDPKAIDALDLYFDDAFFHLIVAETNRCAKQYLESHTILPRHSRHESGNKVTVSKITKILALYFLMGIVHKPEISKYWSQYTLLKSHIFHDIMSRNHFQSILEFSHFNDNSKYNANDPDRVMLYKIRPLVDHIVTKFKSTYTPAQCPTFMGKGTIFTWTTGIPVKRSSNTSKVMTL